jgi:hypothetical protein
MGYIQPGTFENMSENVRNAMLDECFTYDDDLRPTDRLPLAKLFSPPIRR